MSELMVLIKTAEDSAVSPKLRREIQKTTKEIRKHVAAIQKHRDALRELVSDLQAIDESLADAAYNFESGVDALSQYL